MTKSRKQRRAEAIERLIWMRDRTIKYSFFTIVDVLIDGVGDGTYYSGLIDLLSEDECEMELSFDMESIRCSACHEVLSNGTNPSLVRFCPSCGAKVRRAQ